MTTVEAGSTVAGRYTLRRLIGAGGMADVYLATDARLGRDVAVKVLRPGLASDPAFVERFRREAQNAARLNHPNIVSVYDWGSDDGAYYLVMEYVSGSTLKDVLLSRGRRPEREALLICAEVAEALDAAHRKGVIHRDVKPQNVLLDTEGGVKVADFGIARATGESELTHTGTILGSAHYASPEQLERRPVDPRSDVYGLGAVLYELLTGHPPFSADTPLGVAWQHVNQAPVAPSTVAPGVGGAAEAITLKALTKDPRDRQQSAAEMLAEIRAALERRPVPKVATPPVAAGTPVYDGPTIALRQNRPEAARPRPYSMVPPLLILVLLLAGTGLALTRLRSATPLASPPSTVSPGPTAAGEVAGIAATAEPAAPAPAAVPSSAPPPTPGPAPMPAGRPPISSAAAGSATDAVGAFYTAASQGRFGDAAALWSARMRAQYAPEEFIDRRFAQTHSLAINAARLVEQTADRAVVAVDLTEVIGNPPETQRWVGTWTLVRSGDAWLMDAPNLGPG